ncbi:MAG: Holliday junction resolvase RuvX [Flavobacteriales bacterium]|nr:Holliday junction resolvase RuvX [Flavobacteriales bacterium]
MGRLLAIDFGTKRIGIAETDPMQIIASALDTVDNNKIIAFLQDYVSREDVDEIIVGEPKQKDNSPSESEKEILPFIEELVKKFPNIIIKRFDERFTSKMAFQTMIDSGIGKKARRNKGLIDKISATIILQSYLDSKSF